MPQGGIDKKIIILGVAIFLFIVILVLFLILGRKGNPTTETTPSNKLIIWDSFDSEDNVSPLIENFKQTQPNIEVEYVKKNPSNYENDSFEAIASGNPPDIWVIPNNWLPKDQDKLMAMPEKRLDKKKGNCETLKELYVGAVYSDACLDNQVFGLPLFMDSLVLYANPNLISDSFNKYLQSHSRGGARELRDIFTTNIKTWENLEALIKNSNGSQVIALGGTNLENPSDILISLMMQFGAQMTAEDNLTATFHTIKNSISETAYPGTKALEFYISFAQKGEKNYTWNPNGKKAYDAFVQKEIPFLIDYQSHAQKITQDAGFEPEMKTFPQFKDSSKPAVLANYQIFTVPKTAKNSPAAWDFILSLSNREQYVAYLQKAQLNPAQLDRIKSSPNTINLQNKTAQSWYNPDPEKVKSIFNSSIEQVLGGQSAQTALDGAAAEVTSLLKNLSANNQ